MTEHDIKRFWSKVDTSSDCWLWTASVDSNGYGQIRWDGTTQKAYRVALSVAGITPPVGAQVHHVCHVRRCVNPAHLEIMADQAEHSMRHLSGCERHGDDDMRRVKTGRNIGMRYCAVCNREKAAARRRARGIKTREQWLDARFNRTAA